MNEKIKAFANSIFGVLTPIILAVIVLLYGVFSGNDGTSIFSSTMGTLSFGTILMSYMCA